MSFKKHITAIQQAKTPEEKQVQTQIATLKMFRIAMSRPGRGDLQGRPWILDVISGHVGPEARGSVFDEQDLGKVFNFVVDTEKVWFLKEAKDGVAIFQYNHTEPVGTVKAVSLEDVPRDFPVRVESLGDHPALVLETGRVLDFPDNFGKTKTMTAIVEYEGTVYEDDCEEMQWEKGEPLLAAVFPGEPLPPSRPHDCSEGDCMTVETALEKGWKVLKLK